jgi:N-methylhydantoinase B/oxoprolinase/acetone carboxylase alpha subunit
VRLACDTGGTFTDLVVGGDDRIQGMSVISGDDPRNHNEPFVNPVRIGGGGAAVTDSFLSIIHVGNAGICRIDCLEVDELHYPLFLKAHHLFPDTEGAGVFRGHRRFTPSSAGWTAAP